jgi:hypothetical protein
MNEDVEVTVLLDGMEKLCALEIGVSEPVYLRLHDVTADGESYFCEASDLFECLSELRRKYLQPIGAKILCNGARQGVYPSRMSRQMSAGRKAYRVRLGHPAEAKDVVDIFDPAPASEVVNDVAEQVDFHRQWIASLGRPQKP